MSWKTINAILGLATVDEDFCKILLNDPLGAVRMKKFELSSAEIEAFRAISARDLSEFSQKLIATLDKDKT